MKITIFINFAKNLLKNSIAITLDESETLATLNEKIKEYKTPYDSVYNSPIAMPLEYQHKDRIFNSSDLNTSLCNLGLRDNDRLNINISNITIDIMHAALTADLLATNVDDPGSHSTPLSLALLVQRQRRWDKQEILTLQNHLAAISGNQPGDYPQLLSQYAMLNLLRSRMFTEKFNPNIDHYQMDELFNILNESKVDFGKIEKILSQNTSICFSPKYISPNNKLKSNGLVQLAKVLQNNKTIIALILFGAAASIDKRAVTELVNTFQCNTTLETFHLQSAKLKNSSIDILFDSLKNNKTLLNINISTLFLKKKAANALANLLRTSTTLRSAIFDFSGQGQYIDPYNNFLTKAAEDSTSLENFTYNGREIFKYKKSFQLQHRIKYTSDCILSLLNNDFKNFTDVTKRSGHLDFEFAALNSVAEMIINLNLLPNVLVRLMTEYLEKNDIIFLSPLPMTKDILAKKPSFAKLTKDIVLSINIVLGEVLHQQETKTSVVITFTKETLVERKLLLRNALMDLFREKQMNAIADVNFKTGELTISDVTFKTLEELNLVPRNSNNNCYTITQ